MNQISGKVLPPGQKYEPNLREDSAHRAEVCPRFGARFSSFLMVCPSLEQTIKKVIKYV